MIVTASASQRESEECRSSRSDAIHDCVDAVLLEIDAAFLIDHRVAMKSRCDQLLGARVWQEVAGDLLDHEPIERHVVVKCVDHPIAIAPDGAFPVDGVAVRVGVSRDVQPVPAPPLAVVRGLEQPLDQASVGTGFAIADEFPDFRRTRQESGQVQADAADQRAVIRLRRRFQALGFEFGEHERVNRIAYPAVSIHVRRLGPLDWAKRP